ncbi:hypothetical protein M0805_004238 [Coniferiporia weirii]|nr:hypothetical protein M0805_004238 [Coniferiporia weirii]
MALDAAQPAVESSSSTLWAQASKEWVIPAKPKPGRKPKKDPAPPKESQEVDSKGRRVQNRAAQRAFRERKQSQLADLQARVQSYEQGEIERNVALQQISKHLKEENERLKTENAALKEEVARLKGRADAISDENARNDAVENTRVPKRWRDGSAGSMLGIDADTLLESMSRKRFRADTDSPVPSATPARPHYSTAYMHSPPSLASSPDSNGISGGQFSPLPLAPLPAPSTSVHPPQSYHTSTIIHQRPRDVSKSFDPLASAPPFDTFDCGLCTENTPCVCREIALQQVGLVSGIGGSIQDYVRDYSMPQDRVQTALKIEETEAHDTVSSSSVIEIPPASRDAQFIDGRSQVSVPISPKPSVLKNLPARQSAVLLQRNSTSTQQADNNVLFQIRLPSPEPTPVLTSISSSRSVPLPLKGTRRPMTEKVWQLTPAVIPMCSGDPSNCPACKDDDFGKAFCRALGDSASSASQPCASCPNPEKCGKAPRSACSSGSTSVSGSTSISAGLKLIELTPANPDNDRASSSAISTTHSSRPTTTVPSFAAATSAPLSAGAEPSSNPFGSATTNSTNTAEIIPVNEAWARLKSHPNIGFADLSMLADVVARRTKCSGPVTVIHPAPGSITPERDAAKSPAVPEHETVGKGPQDPAQLLRKDDSPILLTDPHAHFKAQEQQRAGHTSPSSIVAASSPAPVSASISALPPFPPAPQTVGPELSLGPITGRRPALVPQEELRECGRRRIREVDAAGVREALRILDAQFGKQR